MPTDERARLLAALEHARRRTVTAASGSPEWEAAVAGAEALERELDAIAAPSAQPATRRSGGTTILFLGPLALADHRMVQGTIAGRADPAEAMRTEARELAGRVTTRREFLHELERAAARRGFAIETEAGDLGVVAFYAWDKNEAPQGTP